jgi:hypothetical protein
MGNHCQERLDLTAQGQVRYRLKTPYRDGTTHIVLEPLDFIARLAALVPPPRVHLTRFHGVFAAHAALRAAITPGPSVFLILASSAATPGTALLLMCGALGTLACTWSGYAPNHLEIAPRHAAVLMGITNTAGTIPGIVGVAITGWLVQVTGTYAAAFVLAAAVSVSGALVWLAFGTSRRVVD